MYLLYSTWQRHSQCCISSQYLCSLRYLLCTYTHTYSTGSQYLCSLRYLLCTYTHTAPEASTFVPCDTIYAPTHTHTAPEASTFVPCDTFYAPTHIQHRKPVPLFLAIPFMHLHTYSTGSQYLCSLRYLLCTYTHTAPEASTFVPCDTFYAPTHIQHQKPVPLFLAIPFMHLHTYSTGSQYICSLRYLLCTYTHTAPEASTFVPCDTFYAPTHIQHRKPVPLFLEIPLMHLHTYSTGSQYICSCDTFYAPTHIQHRKPVPLFLAIPFMHLHTYSTGRQYLCSCDTFYAPTHTISYLWHGRECCTQNIALRTASRAIFCVQHSLQLLRKHYPPMFANSYAEGGILQYTDNDYKDFLDMQRGRTTCLDSLHKENLYCVLLFSHVINDIIVPCPTMPFINSHFTCNAIALAISHAMP